MTLATSQAQTAPSANEITKQSGILSFLSGAKDRALRFFIKPEKVDIDSDIPELTPDLVFKVLRAREAFQHASQNKHLPLATLFTEAASHYGNCIRAGLDKIKAKDRQLFWQLDGQIRKSNISDDPTEVAKGLCAEFAVMAENSTATRFSHFYLNLAEEYRWRNMEASGWQGFKEIFTGPQQK